MVTGGYFSAHGADYRPLEPSRGYWSRNSLHGRAIVGLIGDVIAQRHGDGTLIPARLTVDMFRLATFGTVSIRSHVIKDSRRLRLVEADLLVEGVPTARATIQFLKPADEAPPGKVWSPPTWDAPHPDTLSPPPERRQPRIFEMREAAGRMGSAAPKQLWMRECHALIDGQPLTPYARVALAADFASPYAHASDAGISYINTDVVIHLHRLPHGEWIGFEVTGHDASSGIAVGHCRLYDLDGPIGFVGTTALANERRG